MEILFMDSLFIIYESFDKFNIVYFVFYMLRDESFQKYFEWFVKEFLEYGINLIRIIIYCQIIKQCFLFYVIFKGMLGDGMYVGEIGD